MIAAVEEGVELQLTPQLLTISAKVEAGELEVTEKVYIMPNADSAVVKCDF